MLRPYIVKVHFGHVRIRLFSPVAITTVIPITIRVYNDLILHIHIGLSYFVYIMYIHHHIGYLLSAVIVYILLIHKCTNYLY